jgi:hypothetical protein
MKRGSSIVKWRQFRRLMPSVTTSGGVPPTVRAEASAPCNEPSPAPPADRRRSHSCQCLCPSCELSGAGYFAQLALLGGDREAGQFLSPAVSAFLSTAEHSDPPPKSLYSTPTDGAVEAWR